MQSKNGKVLKRAKTVAIPGPQSAHRDVSKFRLRRTASEGSVSYLSWLRRGSVHLLKLGYVKIVNWTWKAVSFSSLPSWMQDNEFLQENNRPPMYSFRGCLKSMFRLHTETWNIWSHFLGFLFWLALSLKSCVICGDPTIVLKGIQVHNLPWVQQALLLMFFVCEMAVFSFSFVFHLFSNHSKRVYLFLSRLDYSGVTFVITGSFVPSYYYGLYCRPVSLYTHVTIQCILSAICLSITFWNKFGAPKYRTLRFTVFILFGLYAVIPSVQIILQDGLQYARHAYSISGIVTAAMFAVLGALVYVLRVPERFFHGKVITIWFNSHHIWHICCFIVALIIFNSILDMMKYRRDVGGCTEIMGNMEI